MSDSTSSLNIEKSSENLKQSPNSEIESEVTQLWVLAFVLGQKTGTAAESKTDRKNLHDQFFFK